MQYGYASPSSLNRKCSIVDYESGSETSHKKKTGAIFLAPVKKPVYFFLLLSLLWIIFIGVIIFLVFQVIHIQVLQKVLEYRQAFR